MPRPKGAPSRIVTVRLRLDHLSQLRDHRRKGETLSDQLRQAITEWLEIHTLAGGLVD